MALYPPNLWAMSEVLNVEINNGVATLWLDRPDARNAMGPELFADLPTVMQELAVDETVRTIVIAARGEAFSAGLDLKAYGAALAGGFGDEGGVAGARQTMQAAQHMQAAMSAAALCPKPVIAAIHGYCIGAGVDLITACDIRIASEDAVFSIRETRMAMVADLGTLQRLPRIIDPGWVAELAFTGRDFSASEALQMGLVSHVYLDADTTLKAALDLASEIAAQSPLAVQGVKAVLRAGEGRTVQEGLDYVAMWSGAFLHSNDLREAVTAFLEKRDPEFGGS